MTTAFRTFYLVDITFPSGAVRMNNSENTVVWSGNTYNPRPFQVDGVPKSVKNITEGITLTTQNVDRTIAAVIFNEVTQGSDTKIYKSNWVAPGSYTNPALMFSGLVDGITVDEGVDSATVGIEIKNDFVKWEQNVPRHQFSGTCNWVFKSTTPGCQYTGTASQCNRTWERCGELSNQARFRGFRHLPRLEDAEVWWGKDSQISGGVKI